MAAFDKLHDVRRASESILAASTAEIDTRFFRFLFSGRS